MTQEQLDRYEQGLAAHKKFIENYRYFLDRICNHLNSIRPDDWNVGQIRITISNEITTSNFMDAPKHPNQDFANND